MFETATQDLSCKRGETWNPLFQFSIDLSGWGVEVWVGHVCLTDGKGLTLTTGPNSSVQVNMPGSTTAEFLSNQHWYMRLTNPDGDSGFPMSGMLRMSNP